MARLVSTLDPLSCWSTALPRVVHFSVILACPQRSQMGSIDSRLAELEQRLAAHIATLEEQQRQHF
jgi:hypothetical protein